MGESITSSVYVGLDVHKDSIDIALAEPEANYYRHPAESAVLA